MERINPKLNATKLSHNLKVATIPAFLLKKIKHLREIKAIMI